MKKQINPTVKAHLIRSAFYVTLLLAVCVIPFALAQRSTSKQRVTKSRSAAILAASGKQTGAPGSLVGVSGSPQHKPAAVQRPLPFDLRPLPANAAKYPYSSIRDPNTPIKRAAMVRKAVALHPAGFSNIEGTAPAAPKTAARATRVLPPVLPRPAGVACPPTITQSTSQAIVTGNSVACNNGFGTTENHYWRAFDMATFTGGQQYDVTSISFGIESATSGTGTGQPLTVNLYANHGSPFPLGDWQSNLIGTTGELNIPDQANSIFTAPLSATVAAGTLELVMEVMTPDGTVVGNLFFIGSNTDFETGLSYLSAADCGVPDPIPTGNLGFPDMHIVFNVNGSCPGGGTPTPTPTCTPGAGGLLIGSGMTTGYLPNGWEPTLAGNTVNYTFSNSQTAPNEFALFDTHDAWGFTVIKDAITSNGHTYTEFAPAQLAGFNFADYRVIILNWDDTAAPDFVADYTAAIPALEAYINAGGVVWVTAAIQSCDSIPMPFGGQGRSEEHTSELQSPVRISYAVFCLKKKKKKHT